MADSADVRLMDKGLLLQIFAYLNERLKENQLHLEITIYGGTVMTMVYDGRPATRDIDCVFGEVNSVLLKNLLDMTRYAFDLSDNWINEQIKEPLRHLQKEDKETYRAYSNLTILKPRAEQLLAMKVLAARSEPAKDFVDAYILCKDLRITTKEQLFDTISAYVSRALLGERQLSFVRYLGEDLGYDWK